MTDFKSEPLEARPFGQIAGRYPVPFLKEVFIYAAKYDVEKGPQEEGYIFDCRLGAINVWNWYRGAIYTTLYVNWATGEVTLQQGNLKEGKNWTPKEAARFWDRVFANVKQNKPTVLFK